MKKNGLLKERFIAFLLWSLLLFCFAVNVRADNEIGAPFIKNYLPEEYRANPQNWSAVQDDRGVLYFANNDSILVYYGKHWEIIKVTNKSPVRSLAIDDTGRVYVGATDELGYLAYDSRGKLTYISLLNLLTEKNIKFNQIWKIAVGTDGIYFGADHKFFYLQNDKLRVITAASNRVPFFPLYGQIIHVHSEKGLFLLNHGKSRLLPHCRRFTKADSGTLSILPYPDNKILICTEKEGIFVYDLQWLFQEKNASPPVPEKFPNEINHYLTGNPYLRAEKIGDGQYAFINWRKGIAIMDQQGKLIREINKNHGLTTNDINNIFPDRAGNLWAMSNKGISYIETGSPISYFNDSMGLEESVLSVIKHDGTLYAGTFGGVFYLAENKRNNSSINKFLPVKNTPEQCFDFFSRGSILLAAGEEGVFHINGNTGKKILTENFIYCFGSSEKFPDHVFCVGDPGFFALKIEPPGNNIGDGDTLTTTYIPPGKFADLKNDSVRIVIGDRNGNLWLSTLVGELIHLQFTGLEVTDYKITRYNQSHGLPQGKFFYFGYLNDNLIVFNKEGIYKPVLSGTGSNPVLARFEKVSSFPGLVVDPSIFFNRDHINKGKQIFVYSNTASGLLTGKGAGEFLWNPIPFKKAVGVGIGHPFLDQDSVLWKGSHNGLFRYDPAVKKDYRADFPALIKKVIINNSRVIYNGAYYDPGTKKGDIFTGRLDTQPPEMIHTLEYKDNSISFEYVATFYEKESATRFSYILEGFKDEWSQWTTGTKAVYTNLAGGNYCFKVKARNVFEHESAVANYKFIISPPWTMTVYAYVSYVIVMVLLFYVGIRFYSRRLIAAKHRLGKIVSQRTAEISQQAAEIKKQAETLKMQNTELQQQREAAEMANRAKSEFLANMSHELRTPLNAVIGFSEILSSMAVDQKHRNYTHSIHTAGKSLLTLINDILDLSKIESGMMEIKYAPVNLIIIFNEIEQIFHESLDRKNLTYITDIEKSLPALLFLDETRLRQILLNLVGNAVKFTETGHIKLTAKQGAKTGQPDPSARTPGMSAGTPGQIDLVISVEDTGIGIPPEEQELIFLPFKQQSGQSIRKYGGTGLGLSVCQRLTRMMKGRISVASQPGKGSCFKLILENVTVPSAGAVTVPDESFSLDTISFETARVLVVDDVESNRTMLQEMLPRVNLEVLTAENGQEGLRIAGESLPDIIIMDIVMPVMDGYEAAKALKSSPKTKDIPVLVLSASSTVEQKEKIIESGFFAAYLDKPVDVNRLFKELSNHIPYSRTPGSASPGAENPNPFKELPEETLRRLPGLIKILQEEMLPLMEHFKGVLKTEEVKKFADKVKQLGEDFAVPGLIDYANRLHEFEQDFDIEGIGKSLADFPMIVKELVSLMGLPGT